MFKPITFDEICRAMQTQAIVEIDSIVGLVGAIEATGESGRTWIVTVYPTRTTESGAAVTVKVSVP